MKKILVLSVLLGLGFISCNKEPKVTEQTAEQVDNLWAALPVEEKDELDKELGNKAINEHNGTVMYEDSLIIARKIVGSLWTKELKENIQQEYFKNNKKNLSEKSLPKVPAGVKDATTLDGIGYRFSSDVEGDSYFLRFVIVGYKLNFSKVEEVTLKSRLNWTTEGDVLKITESSNPILFEKLTKEMKLGDEIMIQCYIEFDDYYNSKSITGVNY